MRIISNTLIELERVNTCENPDRTLWGKERNMKK